MEHFRRGPAGRAVAQVEGYESTSWEEREENKTYDNDKEEWNTDLVTRNWSGERCVRGQAIPCQRRTARHA